MTTLSEHIYRRVPLVGQHALVSAYGWHWKRLRFGGAFHTEVAALRARERYSQTQWEAHTTGQLRALLTLAYESVPYYQATWRELGLSGHDLQALTVQRLSELPPLEKSVARDDGHSLLVGGKPSRKHLKFHTSGSSGTPIAVYWLPAEFQRASAIREARSNHFANVSYFQPRATFSGRLVEPNPDSQGPYHRFNWFEKQVYFSAFHLRPQTVQKYVDALAHHDIQWMTGYSYSIFQLAQLILERGINAPQLRAVVTTSEPVTPDMRNTIEQAFSTRVFEEYAAVEDLFYVCECEHHRKHISPDAGIVEIVDDAFQPVSPGQPGEVLVTGFIRFSQPMIRYRIGDVAVMDDQPCPCGRTMPVLREVVGRLEDVIYGPDGRRMLRFHGIFVDQSHILEGQIIQETLNHVRVKVVPKTGFGPTDSQDIIDRVRQRLTEKVDVSVELVPEIERTRAGKFKAVISRVHRQGTLQNYDE